jgi:predicted TPR repeat methyltransferase
VSDWAHWPDADFSILRRGTGYWMEYARSHGAHAFGLDLSAEMLARAAEKGGLRGCMVRADMEALPFQPGAADLAVCSLALGYVRRIGGLFRELARVARTVVVSDLHELAVAAGWRRAFRIGGRDYEIKQFLHTRGELDRAAQEAGLLLEWRVESRLGEPEREIFGRSGREDAFAAGSCIPAILSTCWTRR